MKSLNRETNYQITPNTKEKKQRNNYYSLFTLRRQRKYKRKAVDVVT